MGLHVPCQFGFPILRANELSARLENHAADLERHQREAFLQLQLGFVGLHAAVDAALSGDDAASAVHLEGGLALLDRCNEHISALCETHVRCRRALDERAEVDPEDPLIAREPFFAWIDYEAAYRDLAAHGAAVPQRAFWDEVVAKVREGGVRAGERLLERHLRELQSDLRSFIAEVASKRSLAGRERAVALHDLSLPVAALVVGFVRLEMSGLYLMVLCERASQLLERQLQQGEAVAMAG
jgi:hypothetical protein